MSKYDEICTKLLPIENNLISKCKVTLSDVFGGLLLSNIWLRQGWGETKRRYRRTWLGPFWVTCTLLVFSVVLSVIWAKLWNQPFKEYLPFLLSGMIPWTFISGTVNESCGTLISAESSIKSRQFPYSILFYGLIYRNLIVLAHNILVFALIILLVGYSRVYLGDQWLSEVIESYFIAGGFLLLMTVFYEQIKESRIRRQKVHNI